MNRLSCHLIAATMLASLLASAGTLTVTTTDDTGPGSLRQALLDANARPGTDTILFTLAGAGVQTIAPLTPLPDITNTVAIDGYSQPGSQPNTLADGNDAALLIRLDGVNLTNGFPVGLSFKNAGGNTVRGRVIVRFNTGIRLDGSSGNTIAGNWIGLDVDGVARGNTGTGIDVTCAGFTRATGNVIGGTTPADRNVISGNRTGISFFPTTADHNTVQGNFIGTDATGTLPRGNFFEGIMIQSATNILIGGAAPGARNLICANKTGVFMLGSSGNVVQGNFIGTDVSGEYALGNSGNGVGAQGCTGITVGGAAAGAGNRIGNNGGHGVWFLGGATNVVHGNFIGTDPAGQRPLGNAGSGIYVQAAGDNAVGGPAPGAGNTIQFNGGAGVTVSSGERNTISANRIFDHAGPGIDLGANGVTANDPGDADTGANQLQNYPMLTDAASAYGATQVQGTLNAAADATFRLEFFASPSWDANGVAEGQIYLGFASVTTGSDGNASFAATLPAATPAGDLVTATATDPFGNTSEFSAGVLAGQGQQSVSLSITLAGDTQTIRWPSAATGFQLETTDSLTPPVQWRSVLGGIGDDGSVKSYVVSNPPPAVSQFFRLNRH